MGERRGKTVVKELRTQLEWEFPFSNRGKMLKKNN